jgi:multisubunit Na+/H+ antiporter MnhC subunit
MFWGVLFWLLFLSATAYILFKGDVLKRVAIGIMIFGVTATTIIYVSGSHKWLPLNLSILAIDLIALLAFIWISARSRQIWPLLLVAWQLAAVTIHVASSFAVDLIPRAYGIGQGIWAYLQFGTIFVATISDNRKPM